MRALLKEPLLHFIAIGIGLFVLHRAVAPEPEAPPPERPTITVSAERVEALRKDFTAKAKQPPTEQDMEALIASVVKSEVLYREALELGLDGEDPIVRRRLIQKMSMLLEDLAEPEPATEDELKDFYKVHKDRYRKAGKTSLRHIFVKTNDPARLSELRAALEAGTDPATLGKPFPHGHRFKDRNAGQIDALFGAGFDHAIASLEVGMWSDTLLASSYGFHLVQVEARSRESVASFESVRSRVAKDQASQARARALNTRIEELLERYTVNVEQP